MMRGLAAIYVAVGHWVVDAFGLQGHRGVIPWLFGQEAVMVFFLLSGFVVYYSTHGHRDQSFGGYFKRRFLRIYPIFLLALAVSCLLAGGPATIPAHGRELAGNLLFLQDNSAGKPGNWFVPAYGDLPLWSLSYEWWFYLLFFPLYKFVPLRWQLPGAAAVSLAGLATYAWRPNPLSLFALYFILWWTGLELARTYARGVTPTFRTQRDSLLVLGGFCVLVAVVMLRVLPRDAPLSHGLHPLLEVRHFVGATLIVCGALLWSRWGWRGFGRIFGVFAWLAPVSYAIYVFHFPVGTRVMGLASLPNPWLRVALAAALTLALAYLAEIPFQRAVNRWAWRGRTTAR